MITKGLNEIHRPAIIFDFGGVLLEWDPRHLYRKLFPGDLEAMERFLADIGFMEWNMQQDAGRPWAEAVAEHCQLYPEYCELIRAYDERWEESIIGPIQPTVELLYTLKVGGYPLYGLSNWSSEKFSLVRHRYRFLEWFEKIIISGDVKLVKPDPQIFALTLELIDRQASECVVIDDSAENTSTAIQLGFHAIHYQSPEKLALELQAAGILKT